MGISIHALREESDLGQLVFIVARVFISIHALREESDCLRPAGERTRKRISIHALREESDVFHVAVYKDLGISIHALREESDQEEKQCHTEGLYFNPRPPRGERRPRPRPAALSAKFQSTPSARRATRYRFHPNHLLSHVNPRPPRGERQSLDYLRGSVRKFQSTPSARRATINGINNGIENAKFQSTPSARRATSCICSYSPAGHYFNPRPPRGERRVVLFATRIAPKFQSTPSARRATVQDVVNLVQLLKFQSTPSARRAT